VALNTITLTPTPVSEIDSVTVAVSVESVLLCVKLVRTNQKTCQPLMPVRSKHRYVLPLYLFWSYHVIAGVSINDDDGVLSSFHAIIFWRFTETCFTGIILWLISKWNAPTSCKKKARRIYFLHFLFYF
jgi:hypothetical protein